MAHKRKQLRDAVVARLKAAATAAGDRVEATRTVPWRATQLPAISVTTGTEGVEDATDQRPPRTLERTVQVEITAAARPGTGEVIDDVLDALAEQIEAAVDTDDTFGGLALWAVLTGTEVDTEPDGKAILGGIRLTYAVGYLTGAV